MNLRRQALLFSLIFLWQTTALRATGRPPGDSLQRRLEALDGKSVLVFANKAASENIEVALFAFELARQKAERAADAGLLFDVFRDKGFFRENQNQLDSAAADYQMAFRTAEDHQLADKARHVLNDLAIVARKRGQYKAAKDLHFSVLARARAAGDDELSDYSWHGLGFLYEMVGDHELALTYYQKSFEAAQKRRHKNGMMATLGNIAEVHAAFKNEKNAFDTARRGLSLALAERDTAQIAQLNFILADLHEQFERPDSARVFFAECLPWCRLALEWDREADALLRLGQIAENEGDFQTAAAHFRACFERTEVLPKNILAEADLRLGRLALKTESRPEAVRFFQKSLATARLHQLPEAEIAAAHALHDFFAAEKDPRRALSYLERANFLHDSLSGILRERGRAELDFRYDLEKNARDLEALAFRQSRLRMFAVLVFALMLATALGYLIRLRHRTSKTLRAKNEAIREQNARLEESNSFLHQFTTAVAHDLKEPLRSVSSFITLLEKKHGAHFTGIGIEYMGFVQQGVRRMHHLVADLLEFSNISSQRPGTENADARQVLDHLVCQMREAIRQKNARVEYPEELPNVKMNPAHLGFLLQNLIQNGLKFNDNEHPAVKIGARRENGQVQFSVEDNGIGIAPEYASKIFELFHQLNKNKPYGGTGIGLTVAKNIVDKYDGNIWFEAAGAAGGTRFWVSLPSAN